MNVAQKSLMLAVTALLLAGCEKPIPPLPEPTAENCADGNVAKLDKRIQQDFASQCLRRGDFVPSPARAW